MAAHSVGGSDILPAMSRVSLNTLRAALAVCALLVPAVALTACGDDEPAASTGSTPAPLSKEEVAKRIKESEKQAAKAAEKIPAQNPEQLKAPDGTPSQLDSKVADTDEGASAVRRADKTPISKRRNEKIVAKAIRELQAVGIEPRRPPASGVTVTTMQVATSTTILFYSSEREAAVQAISIVNVVDQGKTDGRLARKGSIVVFTGAPKKINDKLQAEFEKVRDAVLG